MKRRAVIFGIRGTSLNKEERRFIKSAKPWGIILFSRNIKSLFQLKTLIKNIKKTIHDKNYPILIDQEGGRVTRLDKIIDFSLFTQGYFGKLYLKDKKNFTQIYKIYVDRVCEILLDAGININTVPVLDVLRKKGHKIIGDRSYSTNPKIVKKIGNICVDLFKNNKVGTVIKHIPGHGAARCDSHFRTPIIKKNKRELLKKDFIPFKKNNSFFAMTAHIIYSAYDSENVATHSKIIIKKIIRKHMKFKGILISDDISMKALKYGLQSSAIRALRAGCNLILHCNGKIDEMKKLSKVIPIIDNFTQKKTSQFYKFLR